MRDEQRDIELIEKYQAGKMSAEDLASFQNKLSTDHSFKEAYEDHIDSIAALKTYHFKEELSNVHKEFTDEKRKNDIGWKYFIGIAASIILIIVFVGLFQDEVYSDEMLFTQYFEPYQSFDLVRGEEHLLSEAMDYYSEGKHEQAIITFQQLVNQSGRSDKVNLYLGISYLGSKDYFKAIENLKLIDMNSIYSEQARWFLALGYLALEDRISAIDYLESISKNQYNYQKAVDLLNSL